MGRSRQVRTRLRVRGVLGVGFAVAILAAAVATGCGGSSHGEAPHGAEGHGGQAAAALPPPTPDTTPIEALRTPAGLVLKIAPATTPAAPAASTTGTATPASTPAPTSPPSK